MAGAAATGWAAGGGAAALVAVLALALVVLVPVRSPRAALEGAVPATVVAAVAVQALLRQPHWGPPGAGALLAAAGITPVLVTGVRGAGAGVRRVALRTAVVVTAAGALASLAFAVAGLAAASDADAGMTAGAAAVDAMRAGSAGDAARLLAEADGSLSAAAATLSGPASRPARLVPVVGRYAAVADATVGAAARMASAGGGMAGSLDLASLRLDAASLDALERRRPLLDALASSSADLDDAVDDLRRDWLLAPVEAAAGDRLERVARAASTASFVADAGRLLPRLLGAAGERRYFVALTTPAESRGLGGLMGNWAELVAVDGQVHLERTGRAEDLIPPPDAPRTLDAPPDYVRRYGLLRPERHPQDVTYSPDLPTVAAVYEGLYPQAGGRPVDGTIVLDPFAMACLLQVTGPVPVPGRAVPLDAASTAEFLLRGQYAAYATDRERAAVLDVLLRTAFDRVLDSTRAATLGPAADAFGPVVRQQRLGLHASRRDEQALIARLGLAGAFPARGEGDLLGVVTQNAGNSKLDAYLTRAVTYAIRDAADRPDGGIEAEVTVALRSDAPPRGLPSTVLGRSAAAAVPGTNRLTVSVYTPHRLAGAAVDGADVGARSATELGVQVHSVVVDVPPQGAATVTFRLVGEVDVGDRYRLRLVAQPLVHPDELTIDADVDGRRLHRSLVLDADRDVSSP